MKGFPNQVTDLTKLATGMRVLVDLVGAGENAQDDGVLGPELVRAGVAGTAHTPRPVEAYIREQLKKTPSNQSFRTTARGLRELYRYLQLIDDSGDEVVVTELGRRAATFAGAPLDANQRNFWRRVIRNMVRGDADGTSHPYQVLLRLVARVPGITRAKCALALEAHDDSPAELDRLVRLARLSEQEIRDEIGVTKPNWDNAKKVLPRFAEQLEDVLQIGQTYVIADAPGRADEGAAEPPAAARQRLTERTTATARAPRSSREVSEETIGLAGINGSDEEEVLPPDLDPEAVAQAVRTRADRLRRHNLLVREFAAKLAAAGARLFEDPFDILGLLATAGILVEVKSLDGSREDERTQVRDALAKLLYYQSFVTSPVAGDAAILKIACFERAITPEHRAFLNRQGIAAIWKEGGAFVGDALAREFLGGHLEEFR